MKIKRHLAMVLIVIICSFFSINIVHADKLKCTYTFYGNEAADNKYIVITNNKTSNTTYINVFGAAADSELKTDYFDDNDKCPGAIIYDQYGKTNKKIYLYESAAKARESDVYEQLTSNEGDNVGVSEDYVLATNPKQETIKETPASSSNGSSGSGSNDGGSSTDAEDNSDKYCYYYKSVGSGGAFAIRVEKGTKKTYVDRVGLKRKNGAYEKIQNFKYEVGFDSTYDEWGYEHYNCTIKQYAPSECPEVIAIAHPGAIHNVYTSESSDSAQLEKCLQNSKPYYIATSSNLLSKEDYYKQLLGNYNLKIVTNGEGIDSIDGLCNAVFGDVTDKGKIKQITRSDGSTYKEYVRAPSLAYIINAALSILRIVAIAILIVMGIIDFSKAALSQKEDGMKKAQMDFVKRVIVCVVIFLVPLFVRITMSLVDNISSETYTYGFDPCNLP